MQVRRTNTIEMNYTHVRGSDTFTLQCQNVQILIYNYFYCHRIRTYQKALDVLFFFCHCSLLLCFVGTALFFFLLFLHRDAFSVESALI